MIDVYVVCVLYEKCKKRARQYLECRGQHRIPMSRYRECALILSGCCLVCALLGREADGAKRELQQQGGSRDLYGAVTFL